MKDEQLNEAIAAKTAPKVTPEQVKAVVKAEQYHVFPGTTLTICCLELQNGFTVTGESACASPDNFDHEIGRQLARRDAERKIWALEGYLLRHYLANA